MSRTICTIDVDRPETWSTGSYLTIDVDWAHDEILSDTIDLIEAHDASATWFVTHNTALLARLRDNPNFELGIHPNFNFLLNGDGRNGRDAAEVIDRLLEIVPEARSVRSHSTTQNSGILDLFAQRGLTHECNSFIPYQSGIVLKPWRTGSKLTRVPYFWEDDVTCISDPQGIALEIREVLALKGIRVFDFHPIHVFLNSESLNRYERTRFLHYDPVALESHRYHGYGTRGRLVDLLALARNT